MDQITRRQEIIQDNFFKHLKSKGITMSAYAQANDLDRTLLSKWKSGVSNMSPEHIYQAASYFNISVNELYYTKSELLRIGAVEAGFEPQIPQKIKLFLNYKPFLRKPVIFIFLFVVIAVIISFVAHTIKLNSDYFMIVVLGMLTVSLYILIRYLKRREQFIINYTDDIYYEAKPLKQVSVKLNIYSRIIMFILMILLLVFCILLFTRLEASIAYIMSLYIVVMLLQMMLLVVSVAHIPFRFKVVRYDNQLDGYDLSLLLLSFSSFQFVYILFTLFVTTLNMPILILSCLLYSVNIIDFIHISKYYNQYEIIFDAHGKPPQKLYQDK